MTLLIDMFPSEGSERALAQRVPAVFGCAEDCVTGNLVQPTVERPIPSQAGWEMDRGDREARAHSQARRSEELAPHEQVGPGSGRGGGPPLGKGAIRLDTVARNGRSKKIMVFEHHPVPDCRMRQIGHDDAEAVFGIYKGVQKIAEIDLTKELLHFREVIRKPEVVVPNLAN